MASATVDPTYGATQTVVSFLTQTGVDRYTPEYRVFDFEISKNAQSVYTVFLETLIGLQERLQIGSSTSKNDLQAVADIINILNNWSKMKTVVSGQETAQASLDLSISEPVVQLIATQLQDKTYKTSDENGATISLPILSIDSNTGIGTLHLDTTMNRYMAETLDTLLRTMRAAGWDPVYLSSVQALPDTSIANLAKIVADEKTDGGSIFGIGTIINKGIVAATTANLIEIAAAQSQSIQQLLMVDYVVRGNEMLFNEMNSLNNAISLNQEILSYLNSLQNLMNQKEPQQFLLQLQYLSNAQDAYSSFEQQTFGNQPLSNVPKFTEDELKTYLSNIQIKNLGLDPTDPLIRAQYGLESSYANLMTVIRDNLSKGYYSLDSGGNIVLSPQGLDITQAAVAEKYGISLVDQARYSIGFLPSLKGFMQSNPTLNQNDYFSNLIMAEKNAYLQDAIPGLFDALQSTTTTYKIRLNEAAKTDPSLPIIQVLDPSGNVLSPSSAGFIAGAGMNGLPPVVLQVLASSNNPFGITYANLSGTDIASAQLKFMQYVAQFFNPITMDTTVDGTTEKVIDGHTFVEFFSFMGTTPYFQGVLNTFKKIVTDQSKTMDPSSINLQDPALLRSYGLIQGQGNSNTITNTNTAIDAFINKTTNSFDASIEQIKQNLDVLINKIKISTGKDSSALAQQLLAVKNDFVNAGTVETWVKDFSSISEGGFQTNLNNAITASQALNDTERENLRQVMFVYEEFYKSATGMLESLSQLITKIANNIRG